MARKADPNSKRQRGFKILNRMQRSSRANAIAKLMTELKVDKPYAETIYATHRKMGKDDGKYVTIYRVMDRKNGKPCAPYMSTKVIFKSKVKTGDWRSVGQAKAAYTLTQREKIKCVKAL